MSTSVLKRLKISKVNVGHAEGYAARNYNFVFSSEISDWMCGVGYSYGVIKRKKRYGTISEKGVDAGSAPAGWNDNRVKGFSKEDDKGHGAPIERLRRRDFQEGEEDQALQIAGREEAIGEI